MTQLRKDIPVFVKSSKLVLLNRFRNRPKELARGLLLELIGAEQLKNMCALGRRKGREAVPADIKVAILCK